MLSKESLRRYVKNLSPLSGHSPSPVDDQIMTTTLTGDLLVRSNLTKCSSNSYIILKIKWNSNSFVSFGLKSLFLRFIVKGKRDLFSISCLWGVYKSDNWLFHQNLDIAVISNAAETTHKFKYKDCKVKQACFNCDYKQHSISSPINII